MQIIDLISKRLNQFPEFKKNVQHIEKINLQDNNITEIPNSIGDFRKLKYLNLSFNNIEFIPESIKECSNLRVLDLRGNPIKKIPFSLCDIETLDLIHLGDDNLSDFLKHSPINSILSNLLFSSSQTKRRIATKILLTCFKQISDAYAQRQNQKSFFYLKIVYQEQYLDCKRHVMKFDDYSENYIEFGLRKKLFVFDSVIKKQKVEFFSDLESLRDSRERNKHKSVFLSTDQLVSSSFVSLVKSNSRKQDSRVSLEAEKQLYHQNKKSLQKATDNKEEAQELEVDKQGLNRAPNQKKDYHPQKTQEEDLFNSKNVNKKVYSSGEKKEISNNVKDSQLKKYSSLGDVQSRNAIPHKKISQQKIDSTKDQKDPNAFNFLDPQNSQDARTRQIVSIAQRRGQPQFRNSLLEIYDRKCIITNCDVEAALEAAHIVPYRGEKTNRVDNGLLLRGDIHTLFDLYLISIHPETKQVVISSELLDTCYQELAGKIIRSPNVLEHAPHFIALKEHYGNFVKRQ